jgi:hypothetical protein
VAATVFVDAAYELADGVVGWQSECSDIGLVCAALDRDRRAPAGVMHAPVMTSSVRANETGRQLGREVHRTLRSGVTCFMGLPDLDAFSCEARCTAHFKLRCSWIYDAPKVRAVASAPPRLESGDSQRLAMTTSRGLQYRADSNQISACDRSQITRGESHERLGVARCRDELELEGTILVDMHNGAKFASTETVLRVIVDQNDGVQLVEAHDLPVG